MFASRKKFHKHRHESDLKPQPGGLPHCTLKLQCQDVVKQIINCDLCDIFSVKFKFHKLNYIAVNSICTREDL